MAELLEVKNLCVTFPSRSGDVQAVRGVDLSLRAGEVLAIVGESGCGKSTLCKAIMHLLPKQAKVTGEILVNGVDIAPYGERELHRLRGRLFSMIFQDPMTALNPTLTVGEQIAEAVRVHGPRRSRAEVETRVRELMELVGIERAEERSALYPHHFSGGMRQRVVLAIALAGEAKLLLADEPTTALDVTVQAQILDLLREIQQKLGTATVLVSHDLGVVARAADRVAVMYAGKIVETGTVDDIFNHPAHPYTRRLIECFPNVNAGRTIPEGIPGYPPNLIDPPTGCRFHPRCHCRCAECERQEPEMRQIGEKHFVACHLGEVET